MYRCPESVASAPKWPQITKITSRRHKIHSKFEKKNMWRSGAVKGKMRSVNGFEWRVTERCGAGAGEWRKLAPAGGEEEEPLAG